MLLTIYAWAVAVVVWVSLLVPESSKFASWLRAMFNAAKRPVDWADRKLRRR